MSARLVGEQLSKAGRLKLRPLCVYSPEDVPTGTVKVSDLIKNGERCLAKAILMMAAGDARAISISADTKGVCFGAMCFMGYAPISKPIMIDIAVSGESAAYLKGTSDVCNRTMDSIGKVTAPGKHLVIGKCDFAGDVKPLSYLCFGNAEQIRNLCGLIHFSAESAFGQIEAPWGSGCSLFVTYPAGMAEGAPRGTAFLGPVAADGNPWLPEDMMVLSIPAAVAERMAGDLERSFIALRPEMTYPVERDETVVSAIKKLK